jgi:hypothetical protein
MKCPTYLVLLNLASRFNLGNTAPAPDHGFQQLLNVPASSSAEYFSQDNPYNPGYRDPYDRKVDSVGEDLHPLPFHNGRGSTIMGPRNKDRERQNPDLVRPPSTDHGSLPNMRWSFADSHVRIEVRLIESVNYSSDPITDSLPRKADGHDKRPSENYQLARSSPV